jgi:DTW domain-containing protein
MEAVGPPATLPSPVASQEGLPGDGMRARFVEARPGLLRPTYVPRDTAAREALRIEHVAVMLERQGERKAARESAGDCCEACTLSVRCCICGVLRPLPSLHAVTVVAHPLELARSSSTHPLLVRGLRSADVAAWGSPETPDLRAVLARVASACAVSKRTPVFLFPAPQALSVAGLYGALSTAERAAGLHIIVLDGTWANVRPMVRGLPSEAPCIVVRPGSPHALFGPIRTQPGPGRVSTLEAVACAFDEWRAAAAAAAAAAAGPPLVRAAGADEPEAAPVPLARVTGWLGRYLAGSVTPSAGPTPSIIGPPARKAGSHESGLDSDDDECDEGDCNDEGGRAEPDSPATAHLHPEQAARREAFPPGYLVPASPLHMRPLPLPLCMLGTTEPGSGCSAASSAPTRPFTAAAAMYLDPTAVRLRCYLMTLVDAMLWQRGQIAGPLAHSRGSGYGTWTMGIAPQRRRLARLRAAAAAAEAAALPVPAAAGPTDGVHPEGTGRDEAVVGAFRRLPVFLVRHILGFVAGPRSSDACLWPQGYAPRHAKGNADWAAGGHSAVVAEAVLSSAGSAAGTVAAAAAACISGGTGPHSPSSVATPLPRQATKLPHLPPGCEGSAIAATCTDFWFLACGRPSPSCRFQPW